jgi:hypothetical protein
VCEVVDLAVLINALSLRSDPIAAQPILTAGWISDSPTRWNRVFAVGALGRFKAPDALITSLFEPQ